MGGELIDEGILSEIPHEPLPIRSVWGSFTPALHIRGAWVHYEASCWLWAVCGALVLSSFLLFFTPSQQRGLLLLFAIVIDCAIVLGAYFIFSVDTGVSVDMDKRVARLASGRRIPLELIVGLQICKGKLERSYSDGGQWLPLSPVTQILLDCILPLRRRRRSNRQWLMLIPPWKESDVSSQEVFQLNLLFLNGEGGLERTTLLNHPKRGVLSNLAAEFGKLCGIKLITSNARLPE